MGRKQGKGQALKEIKEKESEMMPPLGKPINALRMLPSEIKELKTPPNTIHMKSICFVPHLFIFFAFK